MAPSIDAVRHRWIAALNEGSAEGFAACATPGAVWLPPRGDAVVGRDALVGWLAPLFEQFRYEFGVDDVRVRSLGDWVVEEAAFLSVLHARADGDAEPLEHHGHYLLVWRRLDEGWRIDRYVDRTS